MAIYAIGDLHLSVCTNKKMDIFSGWANYHEKIAYHWNRKIKENDTVILAGDTSWGMKLTDSLEDFKLINSFPGKKIVLKGNHDYWWSTVNKINNFFMKNDLNSISLLHNNSYLVEDYAICGSRGWLFENGENFDRKIINREAMRLQLSLDKANKNAKEILLFLHYPPIFSDQEQTAFIDLMIKYSIKRCYYGHIHGTGHVNAFQGKKYGINFSMISSDYLQFDPLKIMD